MAKKKKKKKKTAKAQRGRPRLYEIQEPGHKPVPMPELEQRGHELLWPKKHPLPTRTSKVYKTPCPKCLLLTGIHGQAALRMSVSPGITRFRCRYCEHRWALPNSQ